MKLKELKDELDRYHGDYDDFEVEIEELQGGVLVARTIEGVGRVNHTTRVIDVVAT